MEAAPGSPTALPDTIDDYNVDVDPQGHFEYVADCNLPRIHWFKVASRTAALSPLTGTPYALDLP